MKRERCETDASSLLLKTQDRNVEDLKDQLLKSWCQIPQHAFGDLHVWIQYWPRMAMHSFLSVFISQTINASMMYCGYIKLSDSSAGLNTAHCSQEKRVQVHVLNHVYLRILTLKSFLCMNNSSIHTALRATHLNVKKKKQGHVLYVKLDDV